MADPWLWDESKMSETEIDNSFDDSFNPPEKLPDSDSYVSNLENKLARLQGKGRESKSSEIVKGVEVARGQHLRNLMLQNEQLDAFSTVDETVVTNSVVMRRLRPERQALSAEELQRLLSADELAKIAGQLQALESSTSNDKLNNTEIK